MRLATARSRRMANDLRPWRRYGQLRELATARRLARSAWRCWPW